MKQRFLIEQLTIYNPFDEQERFKHRQMLIFLSKNSKGFQRKHLPGHVTASAWVLDSSKSKVLMTHHVKLEKWLQLGGHADGQNDMLSVAFREAMEESGLISIEPLHENIFDVDVHMIPEQKNFPAHFHYDVRFLFHADETEPFHISNESYNLQWISLEDISRFNDEDSIIRLITKSEQMNLMQFLDSGYW